MSVREEHGAELIEALCGRRPEVVLDPYPFENEKGVGGFFSSAGAFGTVHFMLFFRQPKAVERICPAFETKDWL